MRINTIRLILIWFFKEVLLRLVDGFFAARGEATGVEFGREFYTGMITGDKPIRLPRCAAACDGPSRATRPCRPIGLRSGELQTICFHTPCSGKCRSESGSWEKAGRERYRASSGEYSPGRGWDREG